MNIQEKIAAAGGIKQVVRSLARDVGEGQQAVALLLELSEAPNVCEQIGKTQGCILLLVTMLNSENLHAVEDARKLLEHLSNNDQNVVQMAEANHFSPLIVRLSEGKTRVCNGNLFFPKMLVNFMTQCKENVTCWQFEFVVVQSSSQKHTPISKTKGYRIFLSTHPPIVFN
jgi:hypothetical protein